MKIREIAELVAGELYGNGDTEILSAADIDRSGNGQVTFTDKLDEIPVTGASCVIVSEKIASTFAGARTTENVWIAVVNPKLAFARVVGILHPFERLNGWHSTFQPPKDSDIRADYIGAFVDIGDGTSVGESAQIHAGASIGRNVSIGSRTIIHSNCAIYDGVTIGNNCVIHAGVVIGSDGFGYVKDGQGQNIKFPQIGTVVIEDDVEIGSNTCIDRGALGETRIGEGTKIDNLVQVGHNVDIGKRCVIAAQTGISGSVIIEDDCVIGGQVGFGDHVRVKSGAVIGSQAGVLPGKIVRPGVWWGTPIQPLDEYKRQNAHVKSIERLKAEVKELGRKLEETSSGSKA
ncbi:MAG: UDP-3-O-(3-hydroxymyristoyl)glucosamine N-acyltransferase [Pyrinomonadaceae bacterium]